MEDFVDVPIVEYDIEASELANGVIPKVTNHRVYKYEVQAVFDFIQNEANLLFERQGRDQDKFIVIVPEIMFYAIPKVMNSFSTPANSYNMFTQYGSVTFYMGNVKRPVVGWE
jgi:hypothetical protein